MNGKKAKWTLDEGIQQLFAPIGESGVVDLATDQRQLTLDISFAEGQDEKGRAGISVILTVPDHEPMEDEDTWFFSRLILPAHGETMQELVARIAQCLGIKSSEKIWKDGDSL